MSTERCRHGRVISDTAGNDYRCYQCEPVAEADLEASEEAMQEELDARDMRIAELERVVAQLAERAGLAFNPPKDPV